MNVELQLSELRRSFDVAITKIDGQLAVLLQKYDYAEQRARERDERFVAELAVRDQRFDAHERRLDDLGSLKVRVYFMSGFAAALGSLPGIITLLTKH